MPLCPPHKVRIVSPASLMFFGRGPFVGGRRADRTVHQTLLQSVAVIQKLDRRVGVNRQAIRLEVVVAGEFEVVVQSFAVNGKLGSAGLGDCGNALFGGGVHEIYSGLGLLRQPHNFPEGNILRNVVVGEVKI